MIQAGRFSMKFLKSFMFFFFIFMLVSAGYFVWKQYFHGNDGFVIRDLNATTDVNAIDALFHQGDNMYWMIKGSSKYNVAYMVENATSSQHEPLHNLILKVGVYENKVVGFLAYYPHSSHVWQLLFLIVDQEFRKQGFAKKLLVSAVDDMVKRGALKIILFTRSNNFKAQSLYKNFGFKITHGDDAGIWLSWHK